DGLLLQEQVERQRHLPLLLAPGAWPPYRAKLDRYVRVLGTLYGAVREVSGARLLVNSTKHYWNTLVLKRVENVDLHLAPLVRDSRGVAYSWSKVVEKPETVHHGTHMNRYSAGRSVRRWIGYNLAFELLGGPGVPSMLVRYEDLVREPRIEMERILGWAGVS